VQQVLVGDAQAISVPDRRRPSGCGGEHHGEVAQREDGTDAERGQQLGTQDTDRAAVQRNQAGAELKDNN
jgi:hypothetical protein